MDNFNLSTSFGRPPALHALWRNAEIETILANRRMQEQVLAALQNEVGRLGPVAHAFVNELEADSASNFVVYVRDRARYRRVRDCLATDMVASALLLDAINGGAAARWAIDTLRRQRGFAALRWTAWSLERDAERVDYAGELAAPHP